MKIYISGPITGHEGYMEFFEREEESVKTYFGDASIINPAKVSASLPEEKMKYGDYIKVCMALIDISDMVCMLPGWEDSKGAKLEHAYAEAEGKNLIYKENSHLGYCLTTEIGSLIKLYRKEAGITQEELGERCGISFMSIRRYENGQRDPSVRSRIKIANALKIPQMILFPEIKKA